jgi:hypothetical protein
MALMGGATVEIPRKQIASREGLPVSAMPAGFGAMMTSQQLADLTAYLLSLKAPEPLTGAPDAFEFRLDGGKLNLFLGQKRIATYLLEHDQLTRRAFVNVRTPSWHPRDPSVSTAQTRRHRPRLQRGKRHHSSCDAPRSLDELRLDRRERLLAPEVKSEARRFL